MIALHALGALVDQARAALVNERTPVARMLDEVAVEEVPRSEHLGTNGLAVTCAAFTLEELERQIRSDHPDSTAQRAAGAKIAPMVALAASDSRATQVFLADDARALGAALIAAADLAEGV